MKLETPGSKLAVVCLGNLERKIIWSQLAGGEKASEQLQVVHKSVYSRSIKF